MKEIKNYEDVREFAGRIILLDPNGSFDLGAKQGPYQQDSICFAYIFSIISHWQGATIFQIVQGFNMNLLLNSGEVASSHALTDEKLTNFNIKMRLATAEELNQIERLIQDGEAEFEYTNKEVALRLIKNEKSLVSQKTDQRLEISRP